MREVLEVNLIWAEKHSKIQVKFSQFCYHFHTKKVFLTQNGAYLFIIV